MTYDPDDTSDIIVEGALTLRHVHDLGDWFVIERAVHDGRTWLEPIGPCSSAFMCSSRISDADVEGTVGEMRGIARAIRARASFGAERCAIEVAGDRALFWSPRNSQRRASVLLAEADKLAAQVETLP